MPIDKFTGKPFDKPSDRLPRYQVGHHCEDCGSTLIRDCLRCGAPNCCDLCCEMAHCPHGCGVENDYCNHAAIDQ